MNASQTEEIRKIQANLLKIKETGKAAVNLYLYETKMGLVKSINQNVTLSNGNTESRFDKLILTKKGNQVLGTIM